MTGKTQVMVQNWMAAASGKAFGWQSPTTDVSRAQGYKNTATSVPNQVSNHTAINSHILLLIKSSPAGVGRRATANVVR